MQIWSAEIKELESLHTSIKGSFPELEKELDRLVKADDENMVLLYSRRCLEVIITDLCECQLKRPRKTEPLKGIIDKLHHEEKVPGYIITSMHGLNDLSSYGAHPKDFDPRQVKPVLNNLTTIIEWYLKFKDTATLSQAQPEEVKYESKDPDKVKDVTKKSKKRLIFLASGILLAIAIIVVALFALNIIGIKKEAKEIERTIAVLPFRNLSNDTTQLYFCDGFMEEILNDLQKVNSFTIMWKKRTKKSVLAGVN